MFKKFVKTLALIKESKLGYSLKQRSYITYEWPLSMSEALNALPNLSISSSQIFKQEIPSPPSKNEQTNGSPLGENFQNSIQKFCLQGSS